MSREVQRFGQKLRLLRKNRQMTLIELSQALDYTAFSYLSEIESGKKDPSVDFVIRVARFFGVTTDQLLKDELEIGSTGEE
jgi:transcriptional regulator with XRE-family HTH domain